MESCKAKKKPWNDTVGQNCDECPFIKDTLTCQQLPHAFPAAVFHRLSALQFLQFTDLKAV